MSDSTYLCLVCKSPLLAGEYCTAHDPSKLKRAQHWLYFRWLAIRYPAPLSTRYMTDNETDMIDLAVSIEEAQIEAGKARVVLKERKPTKNKEEHEPKQ